MSASNSSVRIVTDSSCDLPQDVADELGIVIVPLSVRFDDKEFIDREELTTSEFWARCVNSSTLPETAAPAPGQFEAVYRTLAADGATSVVVVSLSSKLSATMQSAQLAARTVAADDGGDPRRCRGARRVHLRPCCTRTATASEFASG